MIRAASAVAACLFATSYATSAAAIRSNTTAPVQGHAPVASDLQFSPSSAVGTKDITLGWKFRDVDGDSESTHGYSWFIVDGDGASTPVSGASTPTLTLPETAINKSVKACVTPRTDGRSTLPSEGVPVCLASDVKPPAPLARDLTIAVNEGDGLFTVTNTLKGTYVYEGVGADSSRAIFTKHNQASKALLSGGGSPTHNGVVGDFSLTGLAGHKVELGILPISEYGGTGEVVVLKSDEYIYDPTLPPLLSTYRPTVYNGSAASLEPVPYVLDRNGGSAGDKSTYTASIGGKVVISGPTNGGAIPRVTIPAGVYGKISYTLTPTNGADISNTVVDLGEVFGSVIDPTASPAIEKLQVTWVGSPAAPSVGTILQATYTFNPNGGTTANGSVYAWRIYKDDTQAEKKAFLNTSSGYGQQVSTALSPSGISDLTIPSYWAGEKVELLLWAKPGYGTAPPAENVTSFVIAHPVDGVPPPVTNPSALPSIDVSSITGVGVMASSYMYGVKFKANTNDGYPIKEIRARWFGTNRFTGESKQYGIFKTQSDQAAITAGYLLDHYVSVELQPISSKSRTEEVKGTPTIVTMASLGNMGPSGSGLEFNTQLAKPDGSKIPLTFNVKSGIAELAPGVEISATYAFTPYPHTHDASTYSWNNSGHTKIETAGVVPSYKIQATDIGSYLTLTMNYINQDKVGTPYTASSGNVIKSTHGFLTGMVVEGEPTSGESSFELIHNGLGYEYLPDGDGGALTDGAQMHTWNHANTKCQSKGSGWRLPTTAELVAISADKVTRPATWPKGHLYWTSEKGATATSYKTVYLDNGTVTDYGDSGSPDGASAITPAVCVKPSP